MKIETILNALVYARSRGITPSDYLEAEKYYRQYHTFRARIIRMDARNKSWVAELTARIAELEIQVVELEDVQND